MSTSTEIAFGSREDRAAVETGLVFAPHHYDFGLLFGGRWSGIEPGPPLRPLAELRAEHGVPILLGEFGIADGAVGGTEWLGKVMNIVDEERYSTTLWEYSVSAERWNLENLSVVNDDGTPRAVLDAYVRPWLRAVAGDDPSFS